jgi:hypothetical protein
VRPARGVNSVGDCGVATAASDETAMLDE